MTRNVTQNTRLSFHFSGGSGHETNRRQPQQSTVSAGTGLHKTELEMKVMRILHMYGLTEWHGRHIYILKIFLDYTVCGVQSGSMLVYLARPGRKMVWLDRLVFPITSPCHSCKQHNMNIYSYLLVKALHIPTH